jgi:putative aldouronate transport system substrate-binding protein
MRWCDDLFVMHGVSMLEGYPQWRWDAKKKVMICDQVSPEMKNALTFIKQLISEGLMDKTMPIKKAGDWMALIENDKVGHYFHTLSGVPRRLAMRQSGANPDAEWVYMPNVKVDGVEHQKNYSPGFGSGFGITTMAKDPKRILKWFDWFGTPEGQTYCFFGIEGLNYKKVGDKIVVDNTVTPVSNKHLYNFSWTDRGREVYGSMPFGDILLNIYDASKDDYQFIDNLMMPSSVYEGYEDYIPASSKLYQEKCSKMVLNELPMSAWDDYVKEWKQKGGDEVTKRVTEWYKKVHAIK